MKSTYFVVAYESDFDCDYAIMEKSETAWERFTEWMTSDWFARMLENDPDATITLYVSTYDVADPWDKYEDETDEIFCWWEMPGDVVTLETFPERES